MVNEPSVFEPLKFYCIINLQLCKGSTGPEVIKLFSCSTQLSMKFFLLINVYIYERENSILGCSEPKKKPNFLIWLVGCFGLNDPFEAVFQSISDRV